MLKERKNYNLYLPSKITIKNLKKNKDFFLDKGKLTECVANRLTIENNIEIF